MKKKHFTEEQIAYALAQESTGQTIAEICRKLGVSEPTFYWWKKKFGSMGVAEVRRPKQLEHESAKLKRLVAVTGSREHPASSCLRDRLRRRRLFTSGRQIHLVFRVDVSLPCVCSGLTTSIRRASTRAASCSPRREVLLHLAFKSR